MLSSRGDSAHLVSRVDDIGAAAVVSVVVRDGIDVVVVVVVGRVSTTNRGRCWLAMIGRGPECRGWDLRVAVWVRVFVARGGRTESG